MSLASVNFIKKSQSYGDGILCDLSAFNWPDIPRQMDSIAYFSVICIEIFDHSIPSWIIIFSDRDKV